MGDGKKKLSHDLRKQEKNLNLQNMGRGKKKKIGTKEEKGDEDSRVRVGDIHEVVMGQSDKRGRLSKIKGSYEQGTRAWSGSSSGRRVQERPY